VTAPQADSLHPGLHRACCCLRCRCRCRPCFRRCAAASRPITHPPTHPPCPRPRCLPAYVYFPLPCLQHPGLPPAPISHPGCPAPPLALPACSTQGFHPTKWADFTTTVDGPEMDIFKQACKDNGARGGPPNSVVWRGAGAEGALLCCSSFHPQQHWSGLPPPVGSALPRPTLPSPLPSPSCFLALQACGASSA
jgi:hypothetical protein